MVPKGEIGKHSTYQKGDMFIHKKHGFVLRITGAGEWRDIRKLVVVKGTVPESIVKARGKAYGYRAEDYGPGYETEYNVCSLAACFVRVGKAARVLYGEP